MGLGLRPAVGMRGARLIGPLLRIDSCPQIHVSESLVPQNGAVPVGSGCPDELHRLGGLNHTHLFLSVLEAGCPRSRCLACRRRVLERRRERDLCAPSSRKDTSPVVGPTRATSSNPHAFGGSQNPSRRRPDLEMGPLPGQLAESRRGRAGGGGLIRRGWCPMRRGDLDTAALEEQAK